MSNITGFSVALGRATYCLFVCLFFVFLQLILHENPAYESDSQLIIARSEQDESLLYLQYGSVLL